MPRRPKLFGLAIVIASLALSACQSVNEAAVEADPLACPPETDCFDPVIPVGPGGRISVDAGDLFFENLVVDTTEGAVEVTIRNIGAAPHNFRIDEAAGDVKKVEASGGNSQTDTLLLFAGEYTYYCDISGHRAAGMEGTIVIPAPDEFAAGAAGAAEEPAEEETEEPAEEAAPSIEDLDDSDDVAGALEANGLARLYQITFASGSSELTDDADGVLQQLLAILEGDEDLELVIEGNTDSAGDETANQALSEQRAQAVVDWLVDNGIDAARLEAVGNGETNLIIADDDTPEEQAVNRRVEVRVK